MNRLVAIASMLAAVLAIYTTNIRAAEQADKDGWVSLFNGKDLEGWEQLNGTAKYEAKDGMIVGTTVLGSPNSFLCTKKHFSNFELEFDVKDDPGLNSGVQIRSESLKEYKNGRVHGYQVEIDPSARAYSGGIYDEARRGWLNDLKDNEPARKAFKNGEWNHFRVLAVGPSMKTWVNGVAAADLTDTMTTTGFVGLQVHQNKSEKPLQVMWRNIRIRELTKTGKPLADKKRTP